MKTKRILFLAGILVIALSCIFIMNKNFNRLSRYPYLSYMSEAECDLLKDNLSDSDIDYIIEYSIAPYLLLEYVDKDNFNIYHIEEYDFLRRSHARLDGLQIVDLVEATRDDMSVYELADLLVYYDAHTLMEYLQTGDQYNVSAKLVAKPEFSTTYLTVDNTISNRVPYILVTLVNIPTGENTVRVLDDVATPLETMCKGIEASGISSLPCSGLVVNEGYVSYERQIELYEEALELYREDVLIYEDYPGHDDAQLGWSVDFGVVGKKNELFKSTEQYNWLVNNAHMYGFIELYKAEDEILTGKLSKPTYWRYVGVDKAMLMYANKISFFK